MDADDDQDREHPNPTSVSIRARMSSMTAPSSREPTLAITTILRCAFSRVMLLGPMSGRMEATVRNGTLMPLGESRSVSPIARRSARFSSR